MDKRRIGSLDVSWVGLGCNNFGRRLNAEATAKVVNAALDEGINFFDTADVYSKGQSEEFLGRALGKRRNDVLIATKFGMRLDEQRNGARPEYVLRACEDSLKRLNTDHIDLYQLHTPDDTVPIADTLGAFDQLVKSGKVREIGCSNFSVDQLKEAENAAAHGAARKQDRIRLARRAADRRKSGNRREAERIRRVARSYPARAGGVMAR